VKDLSTYDYPLQRIVLVDNFISAFYLQPDNGIPILPYYEGKDDEELTKLGNFIRSSIFQLTDVRQVLSNTFHIRLYHEHGQIGDLVTALQEGLVIEGD
jgi:TFIIF-interacting CTD phosphatase-like protein